MPDERDLEELVRRDLTRIELPPPAAWIPRTRPPVAPRWQSLLAVPAAAGVIALALVVGYLINIARAPQVAASPSPSVTVPAVASASSTPTARLTPSVSPGTSASPASPRPTPPAPRTLNGVTIADRLPELGQWAVMLWRTLDQSPTDPQQVLGPARLPARDSVVAVPLAARATVPSDTIYLLSFTGGVAGAPIADNLLREQFSPDGRRLVLSIVQGTGANARVHLVIADLVAGDVKVLTSDDRYHDETPAWSPTGEQIAFVRTTPGGNTTRDAGIWVIDANGANLRRVLAAPEAAAGTLVNSWNGDGSGIAYTTGFGLGTMRVVNVASGKTTELGAYHAQTGRGLGDWRGVPLAPPAFVGGFAQSANGGDQYLVVADGQDGSNATALKTDRASNTYWGWARWRPGSSDSLFIGLFQDPNTPIVGGSPAAPLNTRTIYVVTSRVPPNPIKKVTYSSLFAAWTPDGADIVYVEGLGVAGTVHIIAPDGSNDRIVQAFGGVPEGNRTWLDLAVLALGP